MTENKWNLRNIKILQLLRDGAFERAWCPEDGALTGWSVFTNGTRTTALSLSPTCQHLHPGVPVSRAWEDKRLLSQGHLGHFIAASKWAKVGLEDERWWVAPTLPPFPKHRFWRRSSGPLLIKPAWGKIQNFSIISANSKLTAHTGTSCSSDPDNVFLKASHGGSTMNLFHLGMQGCTPGTGSNQYLTSMNQLVKKYVRKSLYKHSL